MPMSNRNDIKKLNSVENVWMIRIKHSINLWMGYQEQTRNTKCYLLFSVQYYVRLNEIKMEIIYIRTFPASNLFSCLEIFFVILLMLF